MRPRLVRTCLWSRMWFAVMRVERTAARFTGSIVVGVIWNQEGRKEVQSGWL